MDSHIIRNLAKIITYYTAEEILHYFLTEFRGKVAFASSLGAEDQVITHMIAGINKHARIFTLDTGRMFPETYDLIHRTNSKYKIKIEVFFPEHESVEEMVKTHGINLFYDSIENRKLCCHLRKIVPLKRALAGMDAWICGLRKDQAATRGHVASLEWDEGNGMIKVNPLAEWTESQVWEYIHEHKIPYNPLHDQSYPSIGCQPCTRAVAPGEDIRSGRWWWENPDTKECGLHKAH